MREPIKKAFDSILNIQEAQSLKTSILKDLETKEIIKEEKHSFIFPLRLALCAMVLLFCFYIIIPFNTTKIEASVLIEANPSIELKIDNKERVSKVITHSKEATEIIGDMDLLQSDIHVAMNAIVGRMFQLGYLNTDINSLLISVQSENSTYCTQLKNTLLKDLETSSKKNNVNLSILSLELGNNETYQSKAKKYDISEGKTVLIEELLKTNSTYTFEDLINLSIHDLNTLLQAKEIKIDNLTVSGEENQDIYLTKEEIAHIIFTHTSINIHNFEMELECDNNRLVYEVEFTYMNKEYEYEINAISGEIIQFEMDD